MANIHPPELVLSVSDAIVLVNQTLQFAYPSITVEGEVSSFRVSQEKYVFFDLKDSSGTLGCFMMVWHLRIPIEDGMRVVVSAVPKLTDRGRFSLTVRAVRPSGQGALKRSLEILKAKLYNEGLFASERKRPLCSAPHHIAVISSTQAAGFADFIKIVDQRWCGMTIQVAHVQVQGEAAADQIIRAIGFINEQENLPQVIVIIRGGGGADDLAVFNDEQLVRSIASSRVPVMTGIGHEVDESLADLAADVAASTPSNAAELLVPDKKQLIEQARADSRFVRSKIDNCLHSSTSQYQKDMSIISHRIDATVELARSRVISSMGVAGRTIDAEIKRQENVNFLYRGAMSGKLVLLQKMLASTADDNLRRIEQSLFAGISAATSGLEQLHRNVQAFDPKLVLRQGYAIVRGRAEVGGEITIEKSKSIIQAEVIDVRQK